MRPMNATINPPCHALRAGGIATVLLAVAAPVLGQGGKDESEAEVVEEILVTGQKRAGTLLQSDTAYVLDTKAPGLFDQEYAPDTCFKPRNLPDVDCN